MWPVNDFSGVADVAGGTTVLAFCAEGTAGAETYEPITGVSLTHSLKDCFQASAMSTAATMISRRRRIFVSENGGSKMEDGYAIAQSSALYCLFSFRPVVHPPSSIFYSRPARLSVISQSPIRFTADDTD